LKSYARKKQSASCTNPSTDYSFLRLSFERQFSST
jgi:hypothetical protein